MQSDEYYNLNFEGGSSRATFTGQEFGEISVPDGWVAFWKEGGYTPFDTEKKYPYGRPECRVIENTPPYDNPPRIVEGDKAFQLFTFYRPHDAGLYRQYNVVKGSRVTLSAMAHAWSSTKDDPRHSDLEGDAEYNFLFYVGIDPYGGTNPWADSVMWSTGNRYYDVYQQLEPVTAVAQSATITLFLRSATRYPFKHNDAYWDDIEVWIEDIPDQPTEPEPPESEDDLIPEGGYDKEYWVVPADIPLDTRIDIYSLAAIKQVTCGPSADDALAWARKLIALGRTVKAVSWNRKEEDKPDWLSFFGRVPEVVVEFRKTGQEQPEPPFEPEPDEIIHPTNNLVGLHSASMDTGWREYLDIAQPNLMKVFSCGDAIEVAMQRPEMFVIWRKYVENDGSHLIGDLQANALWLVDLISRDIDLTARDSGWTEEIILDCIDGVESLNETVPSHNQPHIEKAVAFDVYFSEYLHSRYGDKVAACLLNTAIGNPHESEVPLLLPVAQRCHEYGDVIGYHTYWAANRETNWLESLWDYHAGRWQKWDEIFTSRGYYPRYYGGECGIVFSTDGSWLDPTAGWKACGDFPSYIEQIVEFNRRMNAWNETHGGRCYGGTLFAFGGWGWDSFKIGVGDLVLLREEMAKYA